MKFDTIIVICPYNHSDMRVLVFGASGFIGFPVCQALVRNGHSVVGQTRNASNAELFSREESEFNVPDKKWAE